MALSQKHAGKILVPWFNSSEWKTVYKLIYSKENSTQNLTEALKILKIWKRRKPLLSSGVEGTIAVLEAILFKDAVSEYILQSVYASALLRFLNLCAANNERQGTFYKTARQNRIPDWIIDLRHEFAHAHQLPSLTMLKLSLNFALEWLEREYWSPQSKVITDYVVEDKEDENFEKCFSSLCYATEIFYSKGKLELEGILQTLFEDNLTNNLHIKHVQNTVLKLISENSASVSNDCLITVLVEFDGLYNVKIIKNNDIVSFPKKYLQAWEGVIIHFHRKNLLLELIKKFYTVITLSFTADEKKKVVALWIREILNGYLKHELLIKKKQTLEKGSKLFSHFNFKLSDESKENLMELKEFILTNPEHYSLLFLNSLLSLTNVNENYINDIELIVKSKTIVDFSSDDKVYNICKPSDLDENLINILKNNGIDVNLIAENSEADLSNTAVNGICMQDKNSDDNGQEQKRKRWKRVNDTSIFKGLPLGVVPGQPRDVNVFISANL